MGPYETFLWGLFGGTMCFITGLGAGLRFPVSLPIWIVGVTAAALWGIPLGAMMWRASSHDTGLQGKIGRP